MAGLIIIVYYRLGLTSMAIYYDPRICSAVHHIRGERDPRCKLGCTYAGQHVPQLKRQPVVRQPPHAVLVYSLIFDAAQAKDKGMAQLRLMCALAVPHA